MLQAFIDRLSGGTRDHLAGVTENLAALGTRLEGLQGGPAMILGSPLGAPHRRR
jgi:hypothetical protein